MNREYHIWHSPTLNRDMELLVFGHAGAHVLVFPTSMGRFYEWEDRGMMGALQEHIEYRLKQYTKCISKSTPNYFKFLLETYNRQLRHKLRQNLDDE